MKRYSTPLLVLALLTGCHAAHDVMHPAFAPGEGAITGQLVDGEKDPFKLSLAGDDGAKAMKIELHSVSGVSRTTYPEKDKSRFSFEHVPPGSYEISVYTVVPGKRTIAGSTPVTVDPGKITPVYITMTVTPVPG
jgi:hypothetical protein